MSNDTASLSEEERLATYLLALVAENEAVSVDRLVSVQKGVFRKCNLSK